MKHISRHLLTVGASAYVTAIPLSSLVIHARNGLTILRLYFFGTSTVDYPQGLHPQTLARHGTGP